ncbi:dihydropteroate synthase [Desulfopila inferna]|uniref:dihydropteroate synthase n=1 Tax=Desulfopila inferna TaxID=468528 RepID=UPI0019636A7B|nr:dihydropteroate synthase [Desulfopila inferna]MBM9606045.1 dihydropteroate synthase [Desulfopila inferna]
MQVMGILNVTPDSFSDGGLHFSLQAAIEQADRMVEEGVDIIDIGGESTRPFAEPVSAEEELNRVIPVIENIRGKHSTPISIDTSKAEVARLALEAGANIINDISALRKDPDMLGLVQSTTVPVIIMHMKGTPGDMQVNPEYDDVVDEIKRFFEERLLWLEKNGVDINRITIDPGIGFGKNRKHNLSIIKHLGELKELGRPLLLAHSRKRFLGDITGRDAEDRDLPTAVVSALALYWNIDMIRVHNVAASLDAVRVTQAILAAE